MKKYNIIISIVGFVMLLLNASQGLAGDRGIEDYPVTINTMPMVRSTAENVLWYIVDGSVDKQVTAIDNKTGQSVIFSTESRAGTVLPRGIMKSGMNITVDSNRIERIMRLYHCLIGEEQDCASLIKGKVLSDEIKCIVDKELGRGNMIRMCIDKQDNRITTCFVF